MFITKVKRRLVNFSQYLGNNCYLSSEDTRSKKYEKRVVVYTFAYGKHLDYYFDYALPALTHESNTKALVNNNYQVEFLLCTTDSKDLVLDKYRDHPYFATNEINIIEFDPGQYKSARKVANVALLLALKKAISESSMLFMAAPDQIISNNSLFNAVSSSFGKNVCFASAHARVKTDLLEKIGKCNPDGIDSKTMVSLCFEFAHENFLHANEDLAVNTTKKGISYKKVANNLYVVHHNLPSPWLIFPTQDDYDFFSKCQDFNMWDREWLQLLIKTNRIKVSGSSDLFFTVEITSEPFNAKDELAEGQRYNDIGGASFHHRVCRTFTSVWRSS